MIFSLLTLLAVSPTVGGCPVFPEDHIWNARVDSLPVHSLSKDYVRSIGESAPLHPDFGAGRYKGALAGIPYSVAAKGQAKVKVALQSRDSDFYSYPLSSSTPIEGDGGPPNGDRHALVIDPEKCQLYELYAAERGKDGSWAAESAAIFDLRGYKLRPSGLTSADAAGLPIFPGLARQDEVAAGEIRHALRFTARRTQRTFVWPGRHFASRFSDKELPPMGQRFRLRADYPVDGFPPQARVILQALKTYGMMLADNGGPWYLSGAPSENWDNAQIEVLKRVRGSDFEAVDVSSLMEHSDSGKVRKKRN